MVASISQSNVFSSTQNLGVFTIQNRDAKALSKRKHHSKQKSKRCKQATGLVDLS